MPVNDATNAQLDHGLSQACMGEDEPWWRFKFGGGKHTVWSMPMRRAHTFNWRGSTALYVGGIVHAQEERQQQPGGEWRVKISTEAQV